MKLNYFSIEDLHKFRSLLQMAVSYGKTDIRTISELVDSHITSVFGEERLLAAPVKKIKRQRPVCPSCGRGTLTKVFNVDGVLLARCTAKCGYSVMLRKKGVPHQ